MNATRELVNSLAAGDIMKPVVIVPRQMLVKEAARLLRRAEATTAAVVDEQGRCVGMLLPADVVRWIDAGCPQAIVGPTLGCPYQVRGRLLTGGEAVICILAHESCPFQMVLPASGGGHTDVCTRQARDDSPFGTVPSYMTTDVITARRQTPFPELVRQIVDAHAGCIIVLDESDRPVGIVSAPDVLSHAHSENE
jgi:predicted transcriptional regulator